MGRKKIKKCTRPLDYEKYFKPAGIFFDDLETAELFLEEFEAIRLCDLDGLSQTEAATKMGISRATVQRLLKSARYKIVDAVLYTKAIKINN